MLCYFSLKILPTFGKWGHIPQSLPWRCHWPESYHRSQQTVYVKCVWPMWNRRKSWEKCKVTTILAQNDETNLHYTTCWVITPPLPPNQCCLDGSGAFAFPYAVATNLTNILQGGKRVDYFFQCLEYALYIQPTFWACFKRFLGEL